MQLHHFKPHHLLSFVQHLSQTWPNVTGPFTSTAVHVTSNEGRTLLPSFSTYFPLKGVTGLTQGKETEQMQYGKKKIPSLSILALDSSVSLRMHLSPLHTQKEKAEARGGRKEGRTDLQEMTISAWCISVRCHCHRSAQLVLFKEGIKLWQSEISCLCKMIVRNRTETSQPGPGKMD